MHGGGNAQSNKNLLVLVISLLNHAENKFE